MSGLCGWIGEFEPEGERPATLQAMAAALRLDEEPGETDLRLDGRVGLAVNGPPRAASLSAAGPVWAVCEGTPRWTTPQLAEIAETDSPAAALVVAYRQYGPELFPHIAGHFACAVADTESRRGLMAIDRFGVRPLCYAAVPGGIVFASTTKALRRHPAVGATLSMQALYNFFVFYRVPAPDTIFAEQRKLLTGQYIGYDPEKGAQTDFYWRMPYGPTAKESAEDLGDELRQYVDQAFGRSIAGLTHDGLGSFLSGGLDSSTVAALYSQRAAGRARTFSIGFDRAGYDETPYARLAARHFGTDHHEYFVKDSDILDLVHRAAAAFDEPFGNASVVPVYYCARLAALDGVETLLAGDGGDEMFAGNPHYRRMQIFEPYGRIPEALRKAFFESGPARQLMRLPLPGLRKLARYVDQARVPLPDRLEIDNPYLGRAVSAIFHPDRAGEIDPLGPWSVMREAYRRPDSGTALQRMMHLDLQMVLADGDIRKVNQMCALAGLDVRYPMLDDDLLAFSGRIPPSLLMKGYRLRHFYKEAFRKTLPQEIIDKPKHGFGLPSGEAIREHGPLKELARDCIDRFRARGILNEAFLDGFSNILEDPEIHPHLAGPLWDIMILELWLQSHIDADTAG